MPIAGALGVDPIEARDEDSQAAAEVLGREVVLADRSLNCVPGLRLGCDSERLRDGRALAGGAVLTSLALMSVASIAGRALFSRPLQGDYELVQTGCALFVALCLP